MVPWKFGLIQIVNVTIHGRALSQLLSYALSTDARAWAKIKANNADSLIIVQI